MLPWHQYLFGILFIVIGVLHLQKPKLFERIIPPYLPNAKTLVLLSGILEMILGLMLLNVQTQHIAAIAILILLVLYLPVHWHMLQNKEASLNLPTWVLILRIPLQFVLMYWVYHYA